MIIIYIKILNFKRFSYLNYDTIYDKSIEVTVLRMYDQIYTQQQLSEKKATFKLYLSIQ